jgi:hypothetical protein
MSEQTDKLKPNTPEQQIKPSLVERNFKGQTSQEKVREVYAFAESLGLSSHQALVRIFNGGLINSMRKYGTERAGIDEIDTRKYQGVDEGYSERLRSLGLRLDDGLYAFPLSQWAPTFTAGLFERETLSIPAHRAAIAIYNGDLLLDVLDDQSASVRPSLGQPAGEFYYFKDPQHKLNALVGIISQIPLEIEQDFAKLPDNGVKITFLQNLLPTFDRENQLIIQDLVFDVRRDIANKVNLQPEDVLLQTQSVAINSLTAITEEREMQFRFIDEFKHQAQMIRKDKGTRGTSVEFILECINNELAREGISEIYRQELQQLTNELKGLQD